MDRIAKVLQFLSWPIACGILVALVILQYQQLQRLNRRVIEIQSVIPPTITTKSYAEAIQRAAPSVAVS